MNSQHFVLSVACTLCAAATASGPVLYLEKFVNTSSVGYQVTFAGQDFTFILPPGTSKNLGHLDNVVDLFQDSPAILVPLKGDGLSIYVSVGPESSGECSSGMPVSVIYWCGPENADSDDKMYQTYCLSQNSSVGLVIRDEGSPEVVPLENIKKLGQF